MGIARWALATGAVALASGAAYAQYRERTEQPDYEVLREAGDIQIRSYAPMIVAEVTHPGTPERARGAGFRRLAAYIFAQDRPGADKNKIAMTSPVIQDQDEPIAMTAPVLRDSPQAGSWRTRFVMPSRYTLDTLPEPPSDITLTQLPGRRMAAIRFNGRARQADLDKAESKLRGWLAEEGIEPAGSTQYAFYDAPMVPGPMRRNEVMIPLADNSSVAD